VSDRYGDAAFGRRFRLAASTTVALALKGRGDHPFVHMQHTLEVALRQLYELGCEVDGLEVAESEEPPAA
jgi:hypothetical protein